MATATPRQPRIPPAVEATGEFLFPFARWLHARDDLQAKADIHERLRSGDPEYLHRAWLSYEAARQWEADRWRDLQKAIPCGTKISYRLGDVLVYYTPADRRGLSLRAVRGGEVIRR